ncbi:hypothetical protein AHiyo8_23430 [Arthrobacter sp. Hiyo8]|nr:hypothetical protein AHiyo8_23430 [Arthrobacter sp. Hiyo8]
MDAGAELCTPFLTQLPVSGAAVSMFGGAASETLVCASDKLAAKLDELQFDLGEGPRWEALRTKLPVLVPDVRNSHPYSWPVFSKAVLETEAAALFVFPVTLGALELGVVELHNTKPGSLSYADYATASVLAGKRHGICCEGSVGELARHKPRRGSGVDVPAGDPPGHGNGPGTIREFRCRCTFVDACTRVRACADIARNSRGSAAGTPEFCPGNDAHGSGGLQ